MICPKDLSQLAQEEARFLLCVFSWRDRGGSVQILHGCLTTAQDTTLCLHIGDDTAEMTVKGKTEGLTRKQYEFCLDDVEKAAKVIRYFCATRLKTSGIGMLNGKPMNSKAKIGVWSSLTQMSSKASRPKMGQWLSPCT